MERKDGGIELFVGRAWKENLSPPKAIWQR